MELSSPKFFRLFFLCLWACTITAAQQISAPAPQPGTIIGTVLDVDGDAVANASIVLQGPDAADVQRFTTQDNGFFRFDAVPAALPCRVVISAEGFANWTSPEIILEPG